jgi:hypothetical protein
MAGTTDNVTPFRRRTPGDATPLPPERLAALARELDLLADALEWPRSRLGASAQRWRAESTSLLARLAEMPQWLAELAEVHPARWPDTAWAVRLRGAQLEVERCARQVTASLDPLLMDAPPHVQARAVPAVSVNSAQLQQALRTMRELLVNRRSDAAGGSLRS